MAAAAAQLGNILAISVYDRRKDKATHCRNQCCKRGSLPSSMRCGTHFLSLTAHALNASTAASPYLGERARREGKSES